MKPSTICKGAAAAGALLVLFWAISVQVQAAVGGGSAKPISPYQRGEEPDEKLVIQTRLELSRQKELSVAREPGKPFVHIRGLGLAFVKGGKIQGEAQFTFIGSDDAGAKLQIDFSDVEGFTVLRQEGDVAHIEVEQFPTLSPAELLQRRPTYTELRTSHFRTARLRVPLKNARAGTLHLVGRDDNDALVPLVAFDELMTGQHMPLVHPRQLHWWAVPSVWKDPAFPYRLVTAD